MRRERNLEVKKASMLAIVINALQILLVFVIMLYMYITPGEPEIATFQSAPGERLGLIVTVGGIMLLGIVSPVYNWLMELAQNSSLASWFIQ